MNASHSPLPRFKRPSQITLYSDHNGLAMSWSSPFLYVEDAPTHSALQSGIRAVIPPQLSSVQWCRPPLRQGCDTTLWSARAVIFLCLDKTVTLPVHRKACGDAFCSGAIALSFLSRQDHDAALWLVAQQDYFATVSLHLVIWLVFLMCRLSLFHSAHSAKWCVSLELVELSINIYSMIIFYQISCEEHVGYLHPIRNVACWSQDEW